VSSKLSSLTLNFNLLIFFFQISFFQNFKLPKEKLKFCAATRKSNFDSFSTQKTPLRNPDGMTSSLEEKEESEAGKRKKKEGIYQSNRCKRKNYSHGEKEREN
jgi:hypothetical protein